MADAGPLQRPSTRFRTGHLTLGLAVVVIFIGLHWTTGRLEVGGGEGWDGTDYARMLREGWSSGTIHTQQRPLIVWANEPAFAFTHNAVNAFDLMNVVYTGLLVVVLSRLLERYGASTSTRIVAVLCVALTNSFRLFVFYPVMVDLGACAVMAWALWLILTGPRWAASLACVAAMLTREYAPILLLFGVHRALRTRAPLRATIMTYLPAVLVWVAVRVIVTRTWANVEDGTTMEGLFRNGDLWADPLFVGLFCYFLVTLAGGVSLLAAARPALCWRFIRQEPEWVSYSAPLVAVTAFGGADLWRYLTPLLPVVVVFYAWCLRESTARERFVVGTAVVALTLWTQAPFKMMDSASYFADWFPYYIAQRQYPFPSTPPSLWPEWGWRFLVVALSVCALMTFGSGRARTGAVTT